uniref:DUF3825 domain-containing protein n=1 Tax=Parolsenella massiliensis TaxID=1871022 RepID=UPI000932B1AD|nr:DUF3825 domain-containing protein [Parolsenella massiliensis]
MAKKHLTEEGPVTLTEANKLYLYALLRDAVGCGRQAFMPRVLEALGEAGITPENLGYDDAEALFAKLGDFCQLTTFKGGRHYVTVTPRADWDEALAAAEESKKPTGKGGKPWKRKKGAVKPVRPKTLAPKVEEIAQEPQPEPEPEPVAAPEPKSVEPEPIEEIAEPVAEEPAPEPEATNDPIPAVTPEPEPEVTVNPVPTVTAVPSILEQIAAQTPAPEPEPAAEPTPAPAPAPVAHTRDDLPRSFADEVSVKPAILGLLTRLLPFDADVNRVLDEDLRVARATGTASGSRNLVTFPLRYLHEDGSAPLTVTIRRQAKAGDARRWQLTLVDGDDGTGSAHEAAGIEGLPQAEGGCWAQLASTSATDADPVRNLAQFMEIGTWEAALGTLATAAAPEKWNYPGEGVGKAGRYGVLRDYLASTLARIRATDALAVAADGSLAAFDTGLSTPMDEELYAVLSPTDADIPWHLDGFATAGSGELGARLSATLPQLPARASYLESIDDIVLRLEAMVIPDYRSLLSAGLDRLPQGFVSQLVAGTGAEALLAGLSEAQAPAAHAHAMRDLARAIADEPGRFRRACRALEDAIELSRARARRSYRHVAPAYDAARNRMLLLLPLALVDDAHADCALALELMPSGAYQAASVVSLSRAYACARIVSAETPAWLAAADVLA